MINYNYIKDQITKFLKNKANEDFIKKGDYKELLNRAYYALYPGAANELVTTLRNLSPKIHWEHYACEAIKDGLKKAIGEWLNNPYLYQDSYKLKEYCDLWILNTFNLPQEVIHMLTKNLIVNNYKGQLVFKDGFEQYIEIVK